MAHRGPDGASGVLLSSSGDPPLHFRGDPPPAAPVTHDVGLGHRRLSIIDLAHGDQPMASRDRLVWLVFNGEIYNYRELREDLSAAGHRFETRSDTEVLLRAYEEYGTRCTEHLNGIFAFAVWDQRHRRLFLARDHFGVKPLYYAQTPAGIAFASEAKALFASKLITPAVDLDALGLTLTFRYTPSPATLFEGVRKLAPGSSLIVREGRDAKPCFFADRHARGETESRGEWANRLATEIGRAVDRQMVSDVPIGLSLSSGVDSNTLLAAMSRYSTEPVRAFTVGFDGSSRSDEVEPARELAARDGATFQARRVSHEEYARFMNRYMWHMEEPIGNESAPAYFFVAEMAREAGVKVLLTGQGPDELFAGYDRHVGIAYSKMLRLAAAPWSRPVIERLVRGRPSGEKYARLVASTAGSSLADQLLGAYTVFSRHDAERLLQPEVYREIDWSLSSAYVEEWLGRTPPGTPLERMLWIDARTLLPDNLLLAEDKMAMAASVEARVPLLDVEFVDLAERVPGAMKLGLGRRKDVYRHACACWIGNKASRRRKIGFATPMTDGFAWTQEEALPARLANPESGFSEYLRPHRLREMLDEHKGGVHDHTRKLHFLTSLAAWHATFCG